MRLAHSHVRQYGRGFRKRHMGARIDRCAVTGAAQQVLPRAHALCMRIAVHCPSQLEEGRLFYDLIAAEEHKIGFAFLGIVISPGFVAKGTYALVSLAVAASTVVLEMRATGVW